MPDTLNTTEDNLTDEVIAQSNVTADAVLDRLIEALDVLDEDEGDAGIIYYSLWVSLTQMLALVGWSSEELCRDVEHHVNLATSEGEMQ